MNSPPWLVRGSNHTISIGPVNWQIDSPSLQIPSEQNNLAALEALTVYVIQILLPVSTDSNDPLPAVDTRRRHAASSQRP
jgi:hypothetical protein